MPKDEHVAVLGRGAAAWNAWRAEHDEVPDLSRAALRGLDLTGFDLSRADLRAADLRGPGRSGRRSILRDRAVGSVDKPDRQSYGRYQGLAGLAQNRSNRLS